MNRLIKFRAGLRRGFSAAKDGLESKAAERKKVDWAMLKRIACLDKRGTAVVVLITWTHTAIYMAIPYFFGEMQKLSKLKLATPEDLAEAERASQAQPPQQAAEAGRPAPEASLLDKIFLKLKDMATSRQTQESAQEPLQKPLAKKELDSQFLTFGTTLVLVNLVAGVLGYLKHVKSKQLENSLAMILKRAIYRDLISRKYDRFLNKSLSPTEIAVKLNSNVSQFTYGLADNMASFVRATLFTGGGSALLFYQLPSFSAMTIGLFGVLFLSSTVFNSLLYESSKSQSDASNKVASYIGDQASNIQSLKILGLQQRSLQMLDKILGFHHKKYMHVANIYGVNIAVLESTHPLRSLRSRRPAAGHPRGLLPDRHWTDSARTHLGRAQHHLRSDRPQRHRQLRQ